MPTIRLKPSVFKQPECRNGDTFDACNLMQLVPHTTVCAGVTGLTFRNCNLLNCDLPADAIVEGGLRLHKSFCAHLHPDWPLDACAEVCSHVVDTDELVVGGMLIETVYHYEDTVVI